MLLQQSMTNLQTCQAAPLPFKAFTPPLPNSVLSPCLHLAQVATAIRGAIIQAKMSVVPVRRGYWGNKIGKVHTVPTKVTGKCGSVTIRLIPAPRGAGIVAARVPKKVLGMAGIEDCYTCSRGSRKTLGNFVKATFYALAKTYGFLSPELWAETKYTKAPLQEFTDFLARPYVGEPKVAVDAY